MQGKRRKWPGKTVSPCGFWRTRGASSASGSLKSKVPDAPFLFARLLVGTTHTYRAERDDRSRAVVDGVQRCKFPSVVGDESGYNVPAVLPLQLGSRTANEPQPSLAKAR